MEVPPRCFLYFFPLNFFTGLFSQQQESFEGQMNEDNIEIGICNEAGFRRLEPTEVKDYLASIA